MAGAKTKAKTHTQTKNGIPVGNPREPWALESDNLNLNDRAEQRLRMCRDGRGLGSNLVSFSKGFSKHPHILAIIKVDSEYLRFSFKLKVDYFILY